MNINTLKQRLPAYLPMIACALGIPAAMAETSAPRVLQVGTYHGRAGAYSTIQAAVDAAKPGDWILIAPGVYHERGDPGAGVMIKTAGIHLRGMDRNAVVVDGTAPGSDPCSAQAAAQDFGPADTGRNGIEVLKVDGVSIENLTACNFLSGTSGGGNQIWWNGGDGSGRIGMGSYYGAYLTATSTFYQPTVPHAAQYGIFVSNARGPGVIENAYGSNMADSAFYVGACPDCHATLRRVHAQNSALGYSGTNAGGHLVLEDSEWDQNRAGIVPSSLAGDDEPSPQDGACPDQPGRSCTVIQRNYVHDNNNPNTPGSGIAALAPVGTGIQLTGGRNNTVVNNLVTHQGAWGILVNDYPDPSGPAAAPWCSGGVQGFAPPPPFDQLLGAPIIPCYFHAYGNRIEGNLFDHNGFFGNATNGDLANTALPYATGNCFRNNVALSGRAVTTAPGALQDPAVAGTCGAAWNPDTALNAQLFQQVVCDAYGPASGACSSPGYPLPTAVKLLPIPHQASMGNPCDGVPANSWCPIRH